MASPEKHLSNQHKEKEFIKHMFSPDFVFPLQDTDDNMIVEVTEAASFGDIADASKREAQNEIVGGTIIGFVCTVRKFHPGNYKVTAISISNSKQDPVGDDPLFIFHHVDVNPNLLVQQVIRMSSDYSLFHRGMKNSINRYDWCHYNVWSFNEFDSDGEDEDCNRDEGSCKKDDDGKRNFDKASRNMIGLLEKKFESVTPSTVPVLDVPMGHSLIYFTKTEAAKNLAEFILKKQIRRSSTIKNLFSVQDDDGNTVSIGVNYAPYRLSEWNYAKAFEDSGTGNYFALVVNGYLSEDRPAELSLFSDEEKLEMGFTTLKRTELKFPLHQFMKK